MQRMMILRPGMLALLLCGVARPASAVVWYDANGNALNGSVDYYLNGAGQATPVGPLAPMPTAAPPIVGNGAQSVTGSAAISGMTVNAAGGALPASLTSLTVVNLGSADAAICVRGGTCTCPENGVATTNGLTLAAQGGYRLNLSGVASTVPTAAACSGTVVLEYQW